MSRSGAARARAKPARSLAERIAELQARVTVTKKKHDLKETIAQARRELRALNERKK